MTGFGRADTQYQSQDISVEMKSINSKNMDLKLKLPQRYREHELALRQLIAPAALRGKVEVTIDVVNRSPDGEFTFNKELYKAYYRELSALNAELGIDNGDIMQTIIRLPNIVLTNEGALDDGEWIALQAVVKQAMARLQDFRATEGQVLARDFKQRVELIASLLTDVAPHVEERRQKVRERIQQNFEELSAKDAVDENRFEQEILYYLEKLDITEEQVRLEQHCNYFLEVLDNGEPVKGRKLGFIAQEMGREINTLGSKANHSGIQRVVVQMKDELEKIKEQLANAL